MPPKRKLPTSFKASKRLNREAAESSPAEADSSTTKRKLPRSFLKKGNSAGVCVGGTKMAPSTPKVTWISKTKAKAIYRLTDHELAGAKARMVRNPKNYRRPISLYRNDDLQILADAKAGALKKSTDAPIRFEDSSSDQTARTVTLHRLLNERGGCPYPRRQVECAPYSPKPLDSFRFKLAMDFVSGHCDAYNLIDVVDQIVRSHELEVARTRDVCLGLQAIGIHASVVASTLGMTAEDYSSFEQSMDVKDVKVEALDWWDSPVVQITNGLYERPISLPLESAVNLHLCFEFIQNGTCTKDELLADVISNQFLNANLEKAAQSLFASADWSQIVKGLSSAGGVKKLMKLAAQLWSDACKVAGRDLHLALASLPKIVRERILRHLL
ncbi:hypothetical protein HDU67_005351 [Dinochytrium kinnereticum]|nr:hypothetical protein HDU67_005351 [Dinochytrium kinnereticum]